MAKGEQSPFPFPSKGQRTMANTKSKPLVSLDQILEAVEADDHLGFCTACGAEADGVEPDAMNNLCEECGRSCVMGAEQLLIATWEVR